ncbi:hypothetical protein ACFYKT_18185 [Cytobacillus sp. FJAT-53684]|uniref:Plasmodium RESA N-terminal domain-containing protein n=1 Tax=Cytobacillus mangrovibacter TaxID=3299024 RepID=A0ABW6K4M7_9BACI
MKEKWERENKEFYKEVLLDFLREGTELDSSFVHYIVQKVEFTQEEIHDIWKEANVDITGKSRKIDGLLCDYKDYITDLEVSAFETMVLFHIRTYLQKFMYLLNEEQKIELEKCDEMLKENADQLREHVREIYNFSESKEPVDQWWWHLNRFRKGGKSAK